MVKAGAAMDQIQLSASKSRRSKSSNDEKKYEVEEILEKRVFGKVIDYRVKWKGYDNRYNSWTPKENLVECTWLIENFEGEYKSKRKIPARKRPVPAPLPSSSTPKRRRVSASGRKPQPLNYSNPPPFDQNSTSQNVTVQNSLVLYQSREDFVQKIIDEEENKMINVIQPVPTKKRVTFSDEVITYERDEDSSKKEPDEDDNMKCSDNEEDDYDDDEEDDALYHGEDRENDNYLIEDFDEENGVFDENEELF